MFFFHVASSEDGKYLTYCPATTNSWCQYQRDKINGTNLYKPGKGLENEVIKYAKLTDERMRTRVLTRLNWECAPKTKFCSLNKLKLCVSYFNYGGQSVIDTLKLSINAGTYTKMFVSDANVCRKYNAGYKGKPSSKHRRKIICGLKKEEK